jgi:hypothetical protein
MYRCERCGTSFSRRRPVVESCPHCLARDGIRVALTFTLFESDGRGARAGFQPGPRTRRPNEGLEAAVRRPLASGIG